MIDASMIRALHFMTTRHDMLSNPGLVGLGPASTRAREQPLIEPLMADLLDRSQAGRMRP